MIVRKINSGWEVIYQHAHGLLAGQIANQLKYNLRPDLWVETLTAVIEHDDNQLNFEEKSYLNEAGMPQDFTEVERSCEENLERAKRVIEIAERKSGWIALLISMHIDFLYGDLENNALFKPFLKVQKDLRLKLRKQYKINKATAQAYYELLRFCDRCSLILCKNELPALNRKLEINQSIKNKKYFIYLRDNGTVGVEPWIFEKKSFEVGVEKRNLDKASYKSNLELKEDLEEAEVIRIKWKFQCND